MSAITKTLTAGALAGAFAAALTAMSAPVSAAEMEKCYGVALAGQNNCAAEGAAHSCEGQSTVDYDGKSFKLVPVGTCVQMQTPHGAGSLAPIDRPA